jgi:hypothetical protein
MTKIFNDPLSKKEDQFTGDPAMSYSIPIFCSAMTHELNHTVEGYFGKTLGGVAVPPVPTPRTTMLAAREQALIEQAGSDELQYLRQGNFFVPTGRVEFFASMSSQFVSNTQRMLDLAVKRFGKEKKEPINQFVFFAEVYSNGGLKVPFYLMNPSTCGLTVQTMTLTRSLFGYENGKPVATNSGFITGLLIGKEKYTFRVDVQGNVTSITHSTLP